MKPMGGGDGGKKVFSAFCGVPDSRRLGKNVTGEHFWEMFLGFGNAIGKN